MATTIKLYLTTRETNEWELIPSKLFVVEDIESYLAGKTAKTITNFQYIKNELEIGINVDLSQEYSQPKSTNNYKYVSIQNDGELIHYYFIKNMIWRSKTCVRFELVMDVLNTYQEGKDYNFKANTRIIREHKDRFVGLKPFVLFHMEEYGTAGSLSIDDEIEFGIEGSGVFSPKFEGIVSELDFDEEIIEIQITDGSTLSDLKAYVNSHTQSHFVVQKDNANSIDFYSDEAIFNGNIYRNIDYVQENINPILQNDNAQAIKVQHNKSKLTGDWYLLYRNQNNPDDSLVNPVECYLIPGDSKSVVASTISGGKIVGSALNSSYLYVINIPYTIYDSTTITLDNGITINRPSSPNHKLVSIKKNSDNTLTITSIYGDTNGGDLMYEGSWTCKYFIINSMPYDYYYKANVSSLSGTTFSSIYSTITGWNDDTFTNTSNIESINAITDLDRTQAKNIKLIKIPYVPYDFTITSNKIDISNDTNWDCVVLENMMALKLNNLNTKLHSSMKVSSPNPYYNLYFGVLNSINPSYNNLRKAINYESKLYHSEFYQPTFFYDSFTFKIQLEKCYVPYYYDYDDYANLNIDFDMTRTINSKFMFTLTNYYLRNGEENYPKVLPVARNNEEVLYNVPYINYIRNGFNYDIKNKNISNVSNVIGLGLSVASIGASLMFPSTALKVAGVVSSITSMAMSVKNTIVSAVQNENSIKQKLQQSQNQASSVAGSDDVDLMSVYAENRLKCLYYEPNEIMKNLLFDLFYYAGYNSNRMGLPNHNTRYNFDYLECEASIEKVASIPNDCLEELINAFKSGITYLHKTSRSGTNKWDFKQVYENWENWLL